MSRLRKIDKLLRLSENNTNAAEADAALRKAGQLMREHLDNPEGEQLVFQQRLKELEAREKRVDKFCASCGREKTDHHKDCISAKMIRRYTIGTSVGCFSCAGIAFLTFAYLLFRVGSWMFG